MLNDLVYLVAFMSVFFIGLGTVTLAVEKIPFLHKMTIRLINAKNEETSKRHCKNK